jgi:hypothetical protein
MFTADPRSLRLNELSQCAYRLGLAFGAEAERAEDHERKLQYFQLFDRCFFAVRVATALELRLWRAPAGQGAASGRAEVSDADPPERDPSEAEGAERDDDRERDREADREAEPVSLPVFLRTLEGVAADAVALPGPPPAALPSLRELLAEVTSAPAAESRTAGLRARLATSASGATVILPTTAGPPPRTGLRTLPLRRATGPPRR